ncbi:hypothetical protein CEXT_811161 [Caerostris extrusa]|uniref:Uncharacterized protein n=1 Tax=Caerostris extrusa TaxID=172846 RepID=A0AAV4VZF4_CAEEX|nr:hypothetical protein CEXT_811161 [Caerostris extrusa]
MKLMIERTEEADDEKYEVHDKRTEGVHHKKHEVHDKVAVVRKKKKSRRHNNPRRCSKRPESPADFFFSPEEIRSTELAHSSSNGLSASSWTQSQNSSPTPTPDAFDFGVL